MCAADSNISEPAMFSIKHSMYLNRSNWFSAISHLTERCFVPPCSPRHTTITITAVSQRHVIIMQISCCCIWFAVTAARTTTGCLCEHWRHASLLRLLIKKKTQSMHALCFIFNDWEGSMINLGCSVLHSWCLPAIHSCLLSSYVNQQVPRVLWMIQRC